MSYEAPYRGLRVVDLSQGIAGPYTAMLLAQYGADVIKVEPPEGDWARILGVRYGDQMVFSIAGNLGKRSIAVDLKTEEGREIVRRLIAGADVFLEGFRPGVTARLGMAYADVAAINPGTIYVSVSGFGQSGLCDALELPDVRDDRRFASSDLRYQHLTELMAKLSERFGRYTTAELARRFRAAGIMHSRVNDYLEFLRDPHVEATGIVTWIEQPGVGRVPIPRAPGLVPPTPGSPRATAPSLDQHRKEILAEIGLAQL